MHDQPKNVPRQPKSDIQPTFPAHFEHHTDLEPLRSPHRPAALQLMRGKGRPDDPQNPQ